jgi:hypothetical protein
MHGERTNSDSTTQSIQLATVNRLGRPVIMPFTVA